VTKILALGLLAAPLDAAAQRAGRVYRVARHATIPRGTPTRESPASSRSSDTPGQRLYVDPPSRLVMVNTGVRKPGLRYPQFQEMGALWSALVRQFGGDHP
jgi:hypothetical protein